MLHYWLQESENDPSSDPVVLWLNGGPGTESTTLRVAFTAWLSLFGQRTILRLRFVCGACSHVHACGCVCVFPRACLPCPCLIWIKGASGIIGMLTELGQLQTEPSPGTSSNASGSYKYDGKGTPPLYRNPFAWTKAANLFTIEQPKVNQ